MSNSRIKSDSVVFNVCTSRAVSNFNLSGTLALTVDEQSPSSAGSPADREKAAVSSSVSVMLARCKKNVALNYLERIKELGLP